MVATTNDGGRRTAGDVEVFEGSRSSSGSGGDKSFHDWNRESCRQMLVSSRFRRDSIPIPSQFRCDSVALEISCRRWRSSSIFAMNPGRNITKSLYTFSSTMKTIRCRRRGKKDGDEGWRMMISWCRWRAGDGGGWSLSCRDSLMKIELLSWLGQVDSVI